MTDVFLSYASEDRDRIIPLVSALEDQGWSVWWDRELIAGPDFTSSIQEALDAASCIVVAWSEHAIESSWVRDEAREGVERQCLVPAVIDNVRPPLGFRSYQTVSLVGWPDQSTPLGNLFEAVRFALSAPASALSGSDSAAVRLTTVTGQKAYVTDERSIAVLPFTNLSSDPQQQYFCDGLADDIITELSTIKPLVVISRNSSFSYKEANPEISTIAGDLRVNYLLTGSVRRSGQRIRVSVRLIDARSEQTVWSKRYDRDFDDLFDLQDDLTSQIVTALDVSLISGEKGRRIQRYRDPAAKELLYRGMFEFHKFEREANLESRRYFLEFTKAEPDSVEGYSWLLLTFSFAIVVGWETPQEALPQLREWVDRALVIDSDDGHALAGDGIFKILAGDLDGALASLQKAVEVEPNLDDAWFYRGWNLMFLGRADEAIESLERSMRLSPLPNSTRFGVLGTALRNAQRYEEAIATFEACLRRDPEFLYAHTSMAVVYGMMGNYPAAEQEVKATLDSDPTYTVKRFITPNLYRSPEVMERCAEELRKAGLPEE